MKKILISKEAPLILRVDEASFLGARQARELIGVVEGLQRRGVQVKLHLLGDTKQMQAIAAGDFLHQVEELGGEVWTRIQKVSGSFNTGAGLAVRLKNVQLFLGEMPPEGSIIIVADDTFTAGGTLAALIDQLALGGRTPLMATTLAVGRYGKDLKPTKELTDGLLQKAGLTEERFELEFGYPPQQLTAAEMRAYLFTGRRGLDGARALFHATGAGRGTGKAESLETREPPLEPLGKDPAAVIETASDLLTGEEVVFDRTLLLKTAFPISGGRHNIAEVNQEIYSSRSLRFVGPEKVVDSCREFFTSRDAGT